MASNKAATQDFVSIKDIRDGVIIQRNGQLCMVLLASSINFALKSTDEQQGILLQFQQFLNTLDFTLQIYVQSRRLNIEPYIAQLQSMDKSQDNDLMRIQLREYIEFIKTFTRDVEVMSKSFFVVVPYSPAQINLKKDFGSVFSPGGNNSALSAEARFEEHRLQLEQRLSLVADGLTRVGVKSIVLKQDELVELFYHIYNPGDPAGSAPALE